MAERGGFSVGVLVHTGAERSITPTLASALAPFSHAVVGRAAATGSSLTSSLSGLIGVVAFFFFAFVAIFLVALIYWTWRDVRSRTQDVILQITATVLVAVFGLGGLFIYLIVRPRQTLAELYERQLEEESLLAEMTERQTCPTCHYRVEGDFQLCPSCGTKLRRPCPRCDHLLELKWNVCPFCGYGGASMDGGGSGSGRGVSAARQPSRAER